VLRFQAAFLKKAKRRMIEKESVLDSKVSSQRGERKREHVVKAAYRERERKQRTGRMERKTESGEGETQAERERERERKRER